jgi:hypothetical protein
LVDANPDAPVGRLARHPVAEVAGVGLVHLGDAVDLTRGHRRDAGDHLVGDPDATLGGLLLLRF